MRFTGSERREHVLSEPTTDPPDDHRIPKLRVPFEIDHSGRRIRAATVDQDSVDEIKQCVYAIVATDIDEREELPEFGSPSQVFSEDYDLGVVTDAIDEWEPRATYLAEADLDDVTERVQFGV